MRIIIPPLARCLVPLAVSFFDISKNFQYGIAQSPSLSPSGSQTSSPSLPPHHAFYDHSFGAPRCNSTGSECSSGNLLFGRGTMIGGKELNAPNTLDGCLDGNSGFYKRDESIERIIVRSGSGAAMATGSRVIITASVWVWRATSNYADFYYTIDAYDPIWRYLGTVVPTGDGARDIIMPYTLPYGANDQAVRVNFRDRGSNGTCTNGSYDERDDLVFTVKQLTLQPTTKPSPAKPTFPPTASQPTAKPTQKPTLQPTSLQPTTKPTVQPTTSQPTTKPTQLPTLQPTLQPTTKQTLKPSSKPTLQPTAYQPTPKPTQNPTLESTTKPSLSPTSMPTLQPTTSQPTSKPAQKPTLGPTTKPTLQPTSNPTFQPTSVSPSSQPSGVPSTVPSSMPSDGPSSPPSAEPSMHPSSMPSYLLSNQPSADPSSQPSSHPSFQPSSMPSNSPSSQLSGVPSSVPSSMPSDSPSSHPSSEPSMHPSSMPSYLSTTSPSADPSSQPSSHPSFQPSWMPSVSPSSQPSGDPSSVPSSMPSDIPSSHPSSEPSMHPSSMPSYLLSNPPTASPVSTSQLPSSVLTKCFPNSRKVKFQALPGRNLQLFSVQVFSSCSSYDIAKGKLASQSSTLDKTTPASAAVDDDKYSFSHTNDGRAWWEVDLGESLPIQAVYIGNNMCRQSPDPTYCRCHLSGVIIILLDSFGVTVANHSLDDTCSDMRLEIIFKSTYECAPCMPPISNISATDEL